MQVSVQPAARSWRAAAPVREVRLLLVSDESGFVTRAAEGLRRWGVWVSEVGDGEEAARRLRADLPDAVVVDLGMADERLDELLGQLRFVHDTAGVRVFARLGGKVVRLFDLGFDRVRAAPIDWEALAVGVRK